MKKIVPFNNVLEFSTDVCDITAISLEHKIVNEDDMISGEFYIFGEYKITDGQLDREKFNFELPFDIALGNNYDRGTLVIDIDDFRYEIVDRNKLKVNIDLYIDGEILEDDERSDDLPLEEVEDIVLDDYEREEIVDDMVVDNDDEVSVIDIEDSMEDIKDTGEDKDDVIESTIVEEKERVDLLTEMLQDDKENNEMDNNINIVNDNTNVNNNENDNSNIDIFDGVNEEDGYVTYRVYRVMEGDTIDKICEKYTTNKEELEKYNNIVDIKTGDKLIIPANDK